MVFYWVFGVVLPVITVTVEFFSGMCANSFFDPIPTMAHVLLALAVPLGNAAFLRSYERATVPARVLLLHGVALGVSAFYAVLFMPMLPLAILGLLAVGLGLLPLTPLLSFLATLLAARRLPAATSPWPLRVSPRACGALVGLGLLLGIAAPTTVTRVALYRAVSEDPAESRRALGWMRRFGSDDTLLRLCYDRSGLATDMVGFLVTAFRQPVEVEKARQVYYRVTGRPFNAVPRPVTVHRGFRDWPGWDQDLGGDVIGEVNEGLSLSASRLDVAVDPVAAVSYQEWVLEFRNERDAPQEARAHLQLPPGGVLTRLTLWIDGEEREAAFGGRGQVRQAYRSVAVVQRRDPVLATSAGPERVMLQCFPVPARGVMKTRVGVVAPLRLSSLGRGALTFPHFVERNFAVVDTPLHAVWVEARSVLRASGPEWQVTTGDDGRVRARAVLRDADLAGARGALTVERPPLSRSWSLDPAPGGEGLVRQEWTRQAGRRPRRVVLVVDGSRLAEPAAAAVRKSLEALPADIEVLAVLAADDVQGSAEAAAAGAAARDKVTSLLAGARFQGGADNVPALLQAWDLAEAREPAAVVWIHGPQPVTLLSPETLRQRLERRPQSPRIYTLAVQPGPNRVLEALDGLALVEPVATGEGLAAALSGLFTSWSTPEGPLVAVRTRGPVVEGSSEERGSPHLPRLWARDEVLGMLSRGGPVPPEAGALAARYRLVTAVSGAVVLENKAQYDANKLDPNDPNQVSSVPEPEMWLLLAVAGALLLWSARQRRLERAPLA